MFFLYKNYYTGGWSWKIEVWSRWWGKWPWKQDEEDEEGNEEEYEERNDEEDEEGNEEAAEVCAKAMKKRATALVWRQMQRWIIKSVRCF